MKKAKVRVKVRTPILGMLLNLIKVALKHNQNRHKRIKPTSTKTNNSWFKASISRSRNQLKQFSLMSLLNHRLLKNLKRCNLEISLMISQLTKWVISKTRNWMLLFRQHRVSSILAKKNMVHISKVKMMTHLKSQMSLISKMNQILNLLKKARMLKVMGILSHSKIKFLKDLMRKKPEIH